MVVSGRRRKRRFACVSSCTRFEPPPCGVPRLKFKPARLEFAAGVIPERTAEGREWPDRRESGPEPGFGAVDDVLSMRAAIAAVRWGPAGRSAERAGPSW